MRPTRTKSSLAAFFEAIEAAMPSIADEPGYFKHNPYAALRLAAWIKRYQSLCDAHMEKHGSLTFTVFDLETTGLESSHKFEVGLAGVTDVAGLKIVDFEYMGNPIAADGTQSDDPNNYEFQSLANPGVEIPEAVVEVTNITNEMVAAAPAKRQVIDDFMSFSQGTILVGHNIGDWQYNKRGFDIPRVLGPIAKSYYGTEPSLILQNAVDTLPMFRAMIKSVSHTNAELGERMGFKLVGAHRAMPDVRVNAIAFARLAKIFYECPVDLLVNWAEVRKAREQFTLYYMSGSADYSSPKRREWINIALKVVSDDELNKEVAVVKYYPDSNRFEYPTATKSGKPIAGERSRAMFTREALFRQVAVFNATKTFEEAIKPYQDITF